MTFIINPFAFGNQVIELARDTSFYEAVSSLTTHTTDSRQIGVASPSRRVFALLRATHSSAGRTLDSATIGGVSATIHGQINDAGGQSNLAAIISAVVPTGTTAQVACTFSQNIANFCCGVIALDGLVSSSPHDSLVTSSDNNATVSGNIDTLEGGYVMAISGYNRVQGLFPTCTWTGLTEYVDDSIAEGEVPNIIFSNYSAAYLTPTELQTNLAVEATWSAGTPDLALVALSWR